MHSHNYIFPQSFIMKYLCIDILQTSSNETDLVGAATVEIATVLNWLKHVQLTMIAINRGSPELSSPVLRYVIIVISGCNYYYTALRPVSLPQFPHAAFPRELVVVPATLHIRFYLFVVFMRGNPSSCMLLSTHNKQKRINFSDCLCL